jgi:hypothetical protein
VAQLLFSPGKGIAGRPVTSAERAIYDDYFEAR